MTKRTGIQDGEPLEPMTLMEVVGSVIAAAFGVQSKANKERDFRQGKPIHFIIVGVVFTVLFLAGLITLVNVLV